MPEINERLPYLREKTAVLTTSPGVYRMRDKTGFIIYIGKAKNLRNRVTSYFRLGAEHTPKVAEMVSRVNDYDFIVTDSEYEALVLECSLIKQHQPKYNILLKDDKGYSYIKITEEAYPRIQFVMQKSGAGMYLGPYTSTFVAKSAVDEVNGAFMLPTCRRKFPDEFRKGRPCLNFHIKKCMGVCRGNVSEEDYNGIVNEALDFVKKGSEASIERLTARMNEAAESLNFELAAKLRDRINAVKRAADSQKIVSEDMRDTDIIASAQNAGEACIALLMYRGGRLYDRKEIPVGEPDLPENMIRDFMLQYYCEPNRIPREIITEEEISDSADIKRLFREISGHATDIFSRRRGRGLKLIQLAKSNAEDSLAIRVGRTGREIGALEELAKLLGLEKPPLYIESYDISNLGETSVVAGMIVFENGRPLKSAYKKFSIKDVIGQNDVACMHEVLQRRFLHYKDEAETDEGFRRLPDLILLDGGQGQISAVEPVLKQLGINVPLFGMVKDNKHRTRAIAKNGGEIAISENRSAFMLVTRIQDEVHRYSINYQRSKHRKSTYALEIMKINGIGEKRAEKLFMRFKTREDFRSAAIEDIMSAAGVNRETAEKVKEVICRV